MSYSRSFPVSSIPAYGGQRTALGGVWRIVSVLFIMSFVAGAGVPDASGQEDLPQVSIPSRMQQKADRTRSNIRSDVKLVLIPITVTDPYERPVSGLTRQNFRVFDEGLEQNITEFFSEDAPVSVGMVFDASNSMRAKIDQSRLALTQFLRFSTPGDEFSLWKFSDRPQPLCPFTTDVGEIEDALALIQSGGWTSLYDAMYLALSHMKKATHGTKALFVLSDGGDNNSRYTESEIKNMVREADVRIFAISIFDRAPSLERISEESGGRTYQVRKLDELSNMALTLSQEIHSHYVVGYLPKTTRNDGKYHKVVVKLIPPGGSPKLRVAWRHGYYAPLH